MNIGMILGQPFPTDIRVEKEARILTRAGHRVFLLAKDRKHLKREDQIEDISMVRVPLARSELRHGLGNWQALLTFVNSAMKDEIRHFINKWGIDAIHVHDLPLVKTALASARRAQVPVIADLHENYPAGLQVWEPENRLLHFLFNGYDRWAAHERRVLEKVEHVIVVVEEARQRLISLGLPQEKVTVVMNTEMPEFVTEANIDPEVLKRYEGYFVMSYIGSYFGSHRGLGCLIDAMPRICREIAHARLLIVGWGRPQYERALRERINQMGVGAAVEFIERQPFHRVPSYLAASNISLIPHDSNPHTEATIPHKLFQAMLLAVPVVVSSCRPLRRVVESARCGLVFEAGNPSSLADAVMTLYRDEAMAQLYAENGRKAALYGEFSFERTTDALKSVYARLRLPIAVARSA